MLMSKKAAKTWEYVLEGTNAPKCPIDISEPYWVNLLFGESLCQVSIPPLNIQVSD